MRLAFFDYKKYDYEGFSKYSIERNIDITYLETKLNIDTVELAKGYDGVIAFVNDDLSKPIIDKLISYGIKAIFMRCAGYNNVDLKECFNHIHVYRVPSYSPYAVAEHAFALLTTLNRRIHKAYNRTREYNFSLVDLVGTDLYQKTIGIIGTGKIGRIMIDIAKGYGMNILSYDKYPSDISGVKYVSLDDLYKESDFISLHCPLTDESFHMINSDAIKRMKKGVMIINTSRGALIDSNALLEGIKSRHIGSAALDVYEEESNIFYNDVSNHILDDDTLRSLIAMPNVIVTSHQAYLTKEALDNIANTTTQNIVNFFNDIAAIDNELCYQCGNQDNCKKKRNKNCF